MVSSAQRTIGFVLLLAGCASHPARVESAAPPEPGRLAVSLADTSLHRGRNHLYFAIVRAGASPPQLLDDPRSSTEVRFFLDRQPGSDPDVVAHASFAKDGPVISNGGAQIPTNRVVDLLLPSEGGGNLQFSIVESNGRATVIGVPVRIAQ